MLANENWPVPSVGDILYFNYIWAADYKEGTKNAEKTRPCVVLFTMKKMGKHLVYVMPITGNTQENYDKNFYMRVELRHRGMCGLWKECGIVYNETNYFLWPTAHLEYLPRTNPPTYLFRAELPCYKKLKGLVAPIQDEVYNVPRTG